MSEQPGAVATGKWYGLAAIFEDQRVEYEQWAQIVTADGGLACPVDGEPLRTGPASPAGGPVAKFCPFCGWQAPRDVVSPQRGVKMGRSG